MKNIILILSIALTALSTNTFAEKTTTYKTDYNVLYQGTTIAQSDEYINQRCRLDIYYPSNKKGFPTVVWFHGGGLQSGQKAIPQELKEKNIAIVAANYRLYPKVLCPVYIEDAAAAVAWTFKNIENYGGDPNLIFISGHSAGGYLASMIGLDKKYLKKYNVDANNIAGLIPFSGHTITHFAVRHQRDIPEKRPIIDEFAPLYHVRDDAPALTLITGDRNLELLGRYEENAYMMRMMKVLGHKQTKLYEIQGHNHGTMVKPACTILLNHIKDHCKK